MFNESEISQVIRQYISDNFLFRNSAQTLSDSDSLMERRLLDSMGVLEMVTFLESRFSIRIHDDEMLPQNMDSITRISKFVWSKLNSAKPESSGGNHAG